MYDFFYFGWFLGLFVFFFEVCILPYEENRYYLFHFFNLHERLNLHLLNELLKVDGFIIEKFHFRIPEIGVRLSSSYIFELELNFTFKVVISI